MKPYDIALALLMYRKADQRRKVIVCLSETNAVSEILRYLVDMRDPLLWAEMLTAKPHHRHRNTLIEEAIAEAQNAEYFSQITKAFLDANMYNDLIMLLERSNPDAESTAEMRRM